MQARERGPRSSYLTDYRPLPRRKVRVRLPLYARRAAINTNQRKVGGVDALAYELKELATRANVGSYMTQANRSHGLQTIRRDLHGLGYQLPAARHLKPKHVEALVAHWKGKGLTDGTIKNRLGWVRFWAAAVRRNSIMLPANEDYGVGRRSRFLGDRSARLTPEHLANVSNPLVAYTLRIQAAFGLRREEAIKFRVTFADRGNKLVLMPSWTKGGRYREIPITHPRQRQLLDELRAAVGDRPLIPDGDTYKQQLQRYKQQVIRAGFGRGHGLRHAYAQWRYRVLTGRPCPARGGLTADQLSPIEEARDRQVRQLVAEELGHSRIDVTDAYLGRRWAAEAKR